MSPNRLLTVAVLLLVSVTAGQCDVPNTGAARLADSVPVPGSGSPVLVVQRPHRRMVEDVAFSPDSRVVASLSWDGTLKLSSARTSAVLRNLPGHSVGSAMSLAFSPDGKLLASGGSTGSANVGVGDVDLWDAHSGALVAKLPSSGQSVYAVFFLRGGRVLAVVASDDEAPAGADEKKTAAAVRKTSPLISFWDISSSAASPKLLRKITTHVGPYFRPALSEPWHCIAIAYTEFLHPKDDNPQSGMPKSTLKMWDTDSGALKHSFSIGAGPAITLEFTPDGKTLVTGGDDRTLRFWDPATGKLRRTLTGGEDDVDAMLNYGWQGRLAAGEASDDPKLSTRDRLKEMIDGPIDAIAFSPDGRLMASAQGTVLSFIKIWDVETGRVVARFVRPRSKRLYCLAFAPDGNSLVSGGGSDENIAENPAGSMAMWDMRLMRLMWERYDAAWETGTADFSASGQALSITYPRFQRQQLWDLRLGRLVLEANGVLPDAEAFSPNGKLLALADSIGDEYAIQLRDTRTDGIVRTLHGDPENFNGGGINAVAFSRDGASVAAAGDEVRVWNAANGKTRAALDTPANSVAFSPNGKYIATLTSVDNDGEDLSGRLMLWDLKTHKSIWTRKQPALTDGSVVFSGDGRSLATVYDDGSIHLINVGNGHALPLPKAFTDYASDSAPDPFCQVDFGPDGHSLRGVTCRGHVVTLDTDSGKIAVTGAGLPWGGYQIYRASHQTWLVDVDYNTIRFWNPDSGKLLLTIDNFGIAQDKWGDTTIWLAHTPDGHYCGPTQGTSAMKWNLDGRLYPADRFHQRYYEENLIARVLNGAVEMR